MTRAAQGNVFEDLPKLVKQLKYRARFQPQRQAPERENTDYTFELSWRRPELADPPIELLRLIDRRFPIKSLELTTNNGRQQPVSETDW